MGHTARMDPLTVEFCKRRIEQLKSQKRELEMKLMKFFTELADCKGRKKRFKEVLKRKIKHPEKRKTLVEQAGLEDAKKHASELDYLEETIKYMEKRKKCIILAADMSISIAAAQELVEQEEELKDKKKRKVKARPDLNGSIFFSIALLFYWLLPLL